MTSSSQSSTSSASGFIFSIRTGWFKSPFVSLCEGYLGVTPSLSLFQWQFVIEGLKVKLDDAMVAHIGGVMLAVRPHLAWSYPHLQPAGLAPGWEREWFYVRNDIDGPMPEFIMVPPMSLPLPPWSCPAEDLSWVDELIGAIRGRVEVGLTGVGWARAFICRRVQPLQLHERMLCELP